MVAVTAIVASAASGLSSVLNIIDKINDQLDRVKNQDLVASVLELQKTFVKIQSDHIKLETEIVKLSSENERLKETLANKLALPQADKLSDEEVSVLKLLYGSSDEQETTLSNISGQLEIDEQKCKYYLEKLENKKFVDVSSPLAVMGILIPSQYSIASKGRAYMIENSLD